MPPRRWRQSKRRSSNQWRQAPACDATIYRKREACATESPTKKVVGTVSRDHIDRHHSQEATHGTAYF